MARAAILYAAKSTADVHGSIPTQLADARAMAEREGYEVVDEFSEEAKSSYKGNRGPQLAAAKARALELASEGVDVAIFVQHSDRISRGDGVTTQAVIQHVWEAQGAGYSFRSCQDDSTFTESSGLMAFVMGLRNHEDSKRKALATSAGIRRRVEGGRHHGRAPLGYRWNGTGDERRLVIDEAGAKIVERIFREYLDGAGVAAITDGLDIDEIAPPRGKHWNRRAVGIILDSPLYVGRVRVHGETFDGEHEPLLDEETWARVVAARASRRTDTSTGRPPNGTHLFTNGLLRCGVCGGAMRARTPRGRSSRYDCPTRLCSASGVLRRDVDEPFLRYLEEVVFDVEATRAAIVSEQTRRASQNSTLLADAERELSNVDASLARVKADYLRGALAVEDWDELRGELNEQHEAATSEVERLRARNDEVAREVAALDLDDEAASRLAWLRHAVAGEITSLDSLVAIRAALRRVFAKITLVRVDDELVLVPEVATFSEIESFARLDSERSAIKPKPERLALPANGSPAREEVVTDRS